MEEAASFGWIFGLILKLRRWKNRLDANIFLAVAVLVTTLLVASVSAYAFATIDATILSIAQATTMVAIIAEVAKK